MKRLGSPPFSCLITKGEATAANFQKERSAILAIIRNAVRDGVTMIQLREKQLPARLLNALVLEAVKIAGDSTTLIMVNERADIAISTAADGVHLPGDSLPPKAIRDIFADRLVIGVSTHTAEEAIQAETGGADYIFFGPVYSSPRKAAPVGSTALAQACEQVEIPIIGLGGIDETNFREVLGSGASGVAAIRSLNAADSRRKILSGMGSP